ncbi:type IV toxin-antitoxin system AbiEi family antitoxin [Campylobacter sputorum]|uniref:type IV toxin-antitoxin system AbiEi family antitoxin n=1 Tax=Campylobacter sputorum TaxID=206 RepID=UPI001D0CFCDE|nr:MULTISPECIES: type IV toxin-antitoxin system AbiEi family antitoxin domain-containing protein [Campylobacter]ASM40501.1 transcriptional regulator, AbiEi antitoxin family [Campylobacter sputorum]
MTIKEMINVLDRLDREFKMPFISINQLSLFFPNEDKKTLRVSLARQVKSGIIVRICRGLYCNPRSKNMPNNMLEGIACLIRDRNEFYLSLESVLSDNGIISQIPNRLTFISKSRSETFHTPYGIIEFCKGKISDIFENNEIYLDKSRGIYVAKPNRAIKDAYLHRRSVDLIHEQKKKNASCFDEYDLQIANNIINTCYWGNTNYTPEYIMENINNKFFAKKIFSAILENSKSMAKDLTIINKNYVKEFIKEWQHKSINFNKERLRLRIDALFNAYIDSSYQLRDKRWN